MSTLFISDLHLDIANPGIGEQLLAFLAGEALQAEALYIVGDLFETWLGDDDPCPHKAAIVTALRAVSDSGVKLFFTRGNRDFLVGEAFARRTGATLLDDPQPIEVHGQAVLLMHGDLLCSDDTEYQQFRRMVRDPQWQAQALALPIEQRIQMAAQMRAQTSAAVALKDEVIMDVNQDTVAATMRAAGIDLLLHGHTHRPAIHHFDLDGRTATRIVLGDWYEQGSVLRWNADGYELATLAR